MNEPLDQEEIDRCLQALSELDNINDYPERNCDLVEQELKEARVNRGKDEDRRIFFADDKPVGVSEDWYHGYKAGVEAERARIIRILSGEDYD